MQFSGERNTIVYQMFVTVCQQRTSTMPKNRGTCGIAVLKSTVKSDGTGTVEKWYRGAAVLPWYHATLLHMILHYCSNAYIRQCVLNWVYKTFCQFSIITVFILLI